MFRRRLRLSAAVAAGLLIAAVAAVPASTAAPRAEDPVVDVTIDSFSPAAPKPNQPVRITGRVTNTSTVALDNPQVIACIDRSKRLETRAEIAAVPAEDDRPMNERRSCGGLANPDSTTFQSFGDQLAPKESVSFSLTVPWEEWRISDSPGVWVVGVLFRGNPTEGDRITAGRARTLMPVIDPAPAARKVSTALVLPLRHRPTLLSGDRYANESLAQSMAPNGRLGRLLAAGLKSKVTWLADPAMLEEARGMANGYQVLGEDNQLRAGTGQKVVKDWLAAFDASRSRHPVVLLPYGDPDVASLIDAGNPLRDLVGKARAETEQAELPGNLPVRSGLWLETGSATGRNLAAASTGYAGAKADDVNLVSSWSWPLVDRPSLSASPVYDVSTPEGPVKTVRTVIADSTLTAGGPDPASAGSPVQVRQRFAAETALLAASGAGPVTVVALPPRSFDPDGRSTAGLVQALSLSWITPVAIDDVLSGAGAQPRPAKPPTTTRLAPGLTDGQLEQIKRLNGSIDVFTSLLTNPEQVDAAPARSLLRATSTTWRGWGNESLRFVTYQQRAVESQLGKVHLVKPSVNAQGSRREIKVNLSGSKGTFPLTIANELNQSVRVGIVVTSLNRTDLRIQPLQSRVLAAGQKATYQVRASAEQNGLIQARAQVVSAGGDPVGRPQVLVIQAAQYGSVGWILVGAAIALLFGTSLVRIYRRVRSERRNPSGPAEAIGPDPLNRAPLDPGAIEHEPPAPPTASTAVEPDRANAVRKRSNPPGEGTVPADAPSEAAPQHTPDAGTTTGSPAANGVAALSAEPDTAELGVEQTAPDNAVPDPAEAGPAEVAPVEVGPVEVAPAEVGPVEVAPAEVAPVGSGQDEAHEVPQSLKEGVGTKDG